MTQYIIIICIITILLWYYYTKSKENDNKYIPVMIRQSELIHDNSKLKQENKKLKLRVKYLENYKNDVSKTFKILDNELVLINEHIKNRASNIPESPVEESNNFQTSLTPSILNSLIRNSTESLEPDNNLFNNIFNRFLTGDMNFVDQLSTQPPDNPNINSNNNVNVSINDILNDNDNVNDNDNNNNNDNDIVNDNNINEFKQETNIEIPEQREHHEQQDTHVQPQSQTSLRFSVNYLPLNSQYRQYLIRRNTENTQPN
jgi:hypothetical protein